MNYQEKCRWLSEFYREAAETGREIQFLDAPYDWVQAEHGPDMKSDPAHWRLKPEPPKAWVVWTEKPVGVFLDEDNAITNAALYGGTIQEITRPE